MTKRKKPEDWKIVRNKAVSREHLIILMALRRRANLSLPQSIRLFGRVADGHSFEFIIHSVLDIYHKREDVCFPNAVKFLRNYIKLYDTTRKQMIEFIGEKIFYGSN